MSANKNTYRIVGIMSGTSFDGLDIAICSFSKGQGNWNYAIEEAITLTYTDYWLSQLKTAETSSNLESLDIEYGQYIGKEVLKFIDSIKVKNIDLIASHGHTIFHEPKKGISFQLGSGKAIQEATGISTCSNFRIQDVKLGGQGAPLVPVGDALLFSEYDYCVNIGGFANLSFEENELQAWDICAANYVLNSLSKSIGKPFDKDGEIAQSSNVHSDLLAELEQLEFFEQIGPKSLSREWVEQEINPILEGFKVSTEDKIATFTEHIARRIANSLKPNKSVLMTGGGSKNKHLINRISVLNKEVDIILPDATVIDFKEALVFAFLGLLKMKNIDNVYSSVTGAHHDHSSGDLFLINPDLQH